MQRVQHPKSAASCNANHAGINIGPIHKKDVLRANVMNEKGAKKFAVILAFDVPVSKEARELAAEYNVKIFTADIIYHLFDQFTAYMKQIKSQEQEAARLEAVFPCVLQVGALAIIFLWVPAAANSLPHVVCCCMSSGGLEAGLISTCQ